jgi:hypothetical protein
MSRRGKNVRVGEENGGEARDGGSESGDCARRRDRHAGAEGASMPSMNLGALHFF